MVLIIKPVSAQLVHDKDIFGKSDPYCVVMIGSQKQRTKAHSGGGKSPQWYDTLQFNTNDSIMRIAVYDDDWGKDDLIGEGNVNLNQLYSNPNRTQNEYVDIVQNGKAAGRVLISMEYQGPPMGGNQGGWGGQQQGYGNQGGWGNQPPQNQGWGQNQGGWGNQPPQNQGWGQNQGGWGGNQGGWGNQPPQNQGWGNQPPNQGWGNQGNQGGFGYGGNNGW